LKLYHFTSIRHMREIQREGRLRTTFSDIHPDGAGPGVVWLTTNPEAKQEWTDTDAPVFILEKYGVRITVEVPDKEAHHYPGWAERVGIAPKWFKVYTERFGEYRDWYVVTRPIGRMEWKAVEMWEGFSNPQTKGYSASLYESFEAFLSGTEVQAWILEAMNREIEPAEGTPPVPVEEWMKNGANRKLGTKKAEMFLGDLRNAGKGGRKPPR